MEYSALEMMAIAAARVLKNEDVCFVGIGAPSEACNLARLTHAPDITLIYESGTIGTRPAVLPLSIGDPELSETALTTVSVPEMFQYWLQGGRISVGFLGGAQLDRFGNINSSVIGDYQRPKVRLPGGGGAPEIASQCGQTYIVMRQNRRTFVEQVDFITSFGYGRGGDHRQQLGITTLGPTLVVTDLCLLRPEPGTHELIVTSLHQRVTREEVVRNTGWPIRFAPVVEQTQPPTIDELTILRELHARTEQAHTGKALPHVRTD
ncbi:CoA-transferase subunit beta [Dictyobacter kobayashii]|uniref:3-oxoadipate--succinyl-CoA transferase subunit B n=1 Tax=Dictyobacter kobayashii TaxID=2014872 RepID=A0A402ACG6_9CHLR|nr:CoA-transferase subunit beta [Dictyobacter kobayashii]GCE16802.1 3-oxoadipate--succinyl-CoA transferase subunit B [Dictyobacter kobayashii]